MTKFANLEDVYTGQDLAGVKDYYEHIEYHNRHDTECMDDAGWDTFVLFDLTKPINGVAPDLKTDAEVFGLESYKTLVNSYSYGWELFTTNVEETKKFLQER